MLSWIWAQQLEIFFWLIIGFDLWNQWANQKNNQLANQPNKTELPNILISKEESTVYRKSRMQSFQVRLLFQLLNLLPTPLTCLRQSMAWVKFRLNIKWPVEWLSVTSGIVRYKAYVLICPYLNQMDGRCQDETILFLAIYDNLFKQRFCIGKTNYILIPLSRNLNKVWNMHAWFSFLLLVPSARNWNVEFILIRFFATGSSKHGLCLDKKNLS